MSDPFEYETPSREGQPHGHAAVDLGTWPLRAAFVLGFVIGCYMGFLFALHLGVKGMG